MDKRNNSGKNAANGKTGGTRKKVKKRGIDKNKLALTISFIMLLFIVGVMFLHGELLKFNEEGITPIDYVQAGDRDPVSGTDMNDNNPGKDKGDPYDT